jgi:hypothetical protein
MRRESLVEAKALGALGDDMLQVYNLDWTGGFPPFTMYIMYVLMFSTGDVSGRGRSTDAAQADA